MKKVSIFSIVLVFMVLLSGCTKETSVKSLNELTISQTYIPIDPAGSSVSVTIVANTDWTISTEIPEWISVSATSGAANSTTTVNISAPACEYGREAVLQIKAGVHTQFITVRQGDMVAEEVTCKEAMTGTAGKTYKVKGAVTKIVNTTYGNLYISDGSIKPEDKIAENACYIYGTLDEKGAEKNFLSLGIEIGDVITVEGPLSYYNPETPELVNVTVLKIEKSLLKIDKNEILVEKEGGNFTIKAAYKGNGASVEFPENSFVSLMGSEFIAGIPSKLEKNPADTLLFKFSAEANEGDARNLTFSIFSSRKAVDDEGKIVYEEDGSPKIEKTVMDVTVLQNGASGTLEMPFTVEEAIKFALNLSAPTTDNYYIKGIVSKVNDQFAEQYGNATFWISDDGTHFVSDDGKSTTDKNHDFECYRVFGLNNAKWLAGEATVSVGDEVIICGQITNYNGLAETNQNKAYIYAINGCTVPKCGAGSKDCPFNVRGAISAATGSFLNANKDYYVAGTITKIKDQFSTQYGNATFWLSDDGTHFVSEDGKSTTDKTHDFEAYQVWWLNNVSWTEGQPTVSVGDKVVLCGKLTNYNGLAETNKQKAYVYSHTPAN